MTDPRNPDDRPQDQPGVPPAPPAYSSPDSSASAGSAAPYATPYSSGGAPTGEKKTLSIVSMSLGIASVVLALFWFLAIPLGAAAIILAVMGKKREPNAKGFWLTGLITGIAGVVLALLIVVIGIIALTALQNSGYTTN